MTKGGFWYIECSYCDNTAVISDSDSKYTQQQAEKIFEKKGWKLSAHIQGQNMYKCPRCSE